MWVRLPPPAPEKLDFFKNVAEDFSLPKLWRSKDLHYEIHFQIFRRVRRFFVFYAIIYAK